MLDINKIRSEFPILSREVNKKPLIYFDNGATAQKPSCVIEAENHYYRFQNANIHRGVHRLSQDITLAYENARITIQKHLNAKYAHEILFTKGTTDSINLVASSFSRRFLKKGDEVIISFMEHHSNILPWQNLRDEIGIVLKVIPINNAGELLIDEFDKLLNSKTKLVSVTQISNTLGTINPVKEIISKAHQVGAKVLIDGAQSVPHMAVDVQDLNADFFVFSGHKLFGPTGVGVLYGKEEILNDMPPYQYGGGIIKTVTFDKTEYAGLPLKFEAGTPHISGGIGLAAAIDYVNAVGLDKISQYEHDLQVHATDQLNTIEGIKIIGNASNKASVISFVANGIHPMDIGTLLDQQGIAVRTGHHCTQPLMQFYDIPGTVRASFAFYNTKQEIDYFVTALNKALKMLN
jgi:cysteine desulfurase/selenocysteine lyase